MRLLALLAIVWLISGAGLQAQKTDTEAFREAQQLYASGKLAEAQKVFAEITRRDPSNIAAQMYLGQTLFREEKFAEAIAPYEPLLPMKRFVPLKRIAQS